MYNLKIEEGQKRLKARLCPHGNHDNEKGRIRKDSSTAQFDVVHLLITVATMLRFTLGCVDVKGAYFQSGPIMRDVFVRPPHEWKGPRGVLWKLKKLPYGISEAGRQWSKVFEKWLMEEGVFEKFYGVSQLYIQRDKNGMPTIILAKVTDDLLMAGDKIGMENLVEDIKKRFELRKVIIGENITFNGGDIRQAHDGSVTLDMDSYVQSICFIKVSPARRKFRKEATTEKEVHDYRTLAGEFLWLVSATLPQASYFASYMQQQIPRLTVAELIEANSILKSLKDLNAVLKYRVPGNTDNVDVLTFSDDSFNISKSTRYSQTGFLTVVYFNDDKRTYQLVDWSSTKQ